MTPRSIRWATPSVSIKTNPPSLRDDQRNWADEMGHFLHLDREAEPG